MTTLRFPRKPGFAKVPVGLIRLSLIFLPLCSRLSALTADGVANALKFALGIEDVRLPYTGASLTPLAVGPDDTHIFTFQRARRDAIYSVEASQDLVDWSTIATNPGTVGSLAEVPFPDPISGRSFMRLRVLADQ